jgi:ADP-ribosylglycohydrolase
MDFLRLHAFVRSTANDKAMGTVIGAALGDAIGLYTEFLSSIQCRQAYPQAKFFLAGPDQTSFKEDGHRDKFQPADWTDDTDQSLLLILSYLHNYNSIAEDGLPLDPQDVALRLHTWVTQGLRCLDSPPLGIGQTVGLVVLDPKYLDDPKSVALKVWLKSGRNAAPNGSLMRTHPIGVMCIGRSLEETFRTAADVGRITHVDPRCVVSCCLVSGLVRGIIRGEIVRESDVDSMIESAYSWVDGQKDLRNPQKINMNSEVTFPGSSTGPINSDSQVDTEDQGKDSPDEHSLLDTDEYHKYCHAQTLKELNLDEGRKIGYVYKCLGSAVLVLRLAIRYGTGVNLGSQDLFETLITDLIMKGGDADTNACVAGGLLGALVGYSRLPPHWERGIRNRQWLLRKAESLTLRVGILESHLGEKEKSPEADPDTALDGGKGMLSEEQIEKRWKDFVLMILEKQQKRREAEKAKTKTGLGKWFR